MIIWKFKGTETKFRSTPATHQRDIFKMSKACGLPPETEIIYEHGKPIGNTIKDTFAVDDSTSDSTQPTVPKPTKTRKPRREKTDSVPPVSVVLDSTGPIYNALESGYGTSGTSGGGSSLDD